MVDIYKTFLTASTVFYTAVGSCATLFYTIAFIATLTYLKREIHEMRLATYASAYKSVVEILQTEEVLAAREYIFIKLENKPFKSWSKKDKREAEKVCRSYDAVGQMVRHEFLPKEYIVGNWGPSLQKSWLILLPLVLFKREQLKSPNVWDDYEWLTKEVYLSQTLLS